MRLGSLSQRFRCLLGDSAGDVLSAIALIYPTPFFVIAFDLLPLYYRLIFVISVRDRKMEN